MSKEQITCNFHESTCLFRLCRDLSVLLSPSEVKGAADDFHCALNKVKTVIEAA